MERRRKATKSPNNNLGKVVRLTNEQAKQLAITPFKEANGIFEELAAWRKRSLSTNIRM